MVDRSRHRARAGRRLHGGVVGDGHRRRRLVRQLDGPEGPHSCRRSDGDGRTGRGVRADRRTLAGRARAGASFRRRPDAEPVDPRRQSPAVRLGDRLVVADRGQPVRHPPRDGARHARVPVGRQVDRYGRGLQPPGVGGGDRTRPLGRRGVARPSRVELRQPVLRGRRTGGPHDERDRAAQGGTARRRLLRVLRPPAVGHPDDDRVRRRGLPRAARRKAAGPPRRSTPDRALVDVRVAAGLHDRDQPRRQRPRRADGHVRRARRDLRRPARVRRGRPPLRAGAGGHVGGAARHRSADRPHRAGRALRAAALPARGPLRPRPDARRSVRRAQRRDARRAGRPAVRRGGVR